MAAWWTCWVTLPSGAKCFDRMAHNDDPRIVERDRDAHLRNCHSGATIEPWLLCVVHGQEAGDAPRVQV